LREDDRRGSKGAVTRVLRGRREVIFGHTGFFENVERQVIETVGLGSVVCKWV
jgi:hypothetical protein